MGTNGCWPKLVGADSVSAFVKMWAFDVAATEMASGTVDGEPTVPMPNISRSLPAEITGTTPAFATFATTCVKGPRRGRSAGRRRRS